MNIPKKEISDDTLKDSVLAQISATYFSVGKRLERKTQCTATRGFILSTLRDGATLNQNQIATLLSMDRTVVHRTIKSMVHEGLVMERKAQSGRAIHVILTAKGNKYRQQLIRARMAADELVTKQITPDERATLLRLLKVVSECEF